MVAVLDATVKDKFEHKKASIFIYWLFYRIIPDFFVLLQGFPNVQVFPAAALQFQQYVFAIQLPVYSHF